MRHPRQRSLTAACAVLLLHCCFPRIRRHPRPLQIDFPEDLAAKAIDPFVRAEGHLLVLLFVRTDCPISNRYAPTIQNLSEKFHHKAYFWLVYPDAHESAAR